eukprot:TRINITY_DN32111_c2_g1_i1.p1 TRINITY_DN32111_c2_g1~~TRINITY_DN32111_c2_g1_i1.p1  ORF type:complete len:528 (-),score=75.99 TRINITY_DN32111_c2_g1_i1:287-1870(-)
MKFALDLLKSSVSATFNEVSTNLEIASSSAGNVVRGFGGTYGPALCVTVVTALVVVYWLSQNRSTSGRLKLEFDKASWWGRAVIYMFAAQVLFLWRSAFEAYVPLMPIYAKSLNFDQSYNGLVMAALQMGWFVGLPLYPWLINNIGAKGVVITSLFVFSISVWPFILHQSFFGLFLARSFEGLALSQLFPTLEAIVSQQFPPEERGSAFAWVTILASSGACFGLLSAVFIFPYYGTAGTLLCLSMVGMVILYGNMFLLHAPENISEETEDSKKPGMKSAAFFLHRLLGDRPSAGLLLMQTASVCHSAALVVVIPIKLAEKLSMADLSALWLVAAVLDFPAIWIGGCAADTASPLLVTRIVLLLQSALVGLLLLFSSNLAVFQPVVVLWLLFQSTSSPFMKPVYGKLCALIEERQESPAFEELFAASHFSKAVGYTLGGLAAAAGHGLGFEKFVAASLAVSSILVLFGSSLLSETDLILCSDSLPPASGKLAEGEGSQRQFSVFSEAGQRQLSAQGQEIFQRQVSGTV